MAKRTKKGFEIIRDKSAYKSIAFTREEREQLGLRGLLPFKVSTQEELISRVMEALGRQEKNIDKYMPIVIGLIDFAIEQNFRAGDESSALSNSSISIASAFFE